MLLKLGILTSIWAIYYFCLCIFNRKRSREWNCRIVAFTHSFLVCRMTEYFIFLDSWPLNRIGGQIMDNDYIILYFSASYFMFDLIWCLYMGTEGPVMFVHHIVCVLGIPSVVYFGANSAEAIFCIWGGELTNPFLQIRWFLKETNHGSSSFSWWNDFLFALSFLFIRAGVFTVLAYYFYFAPCQVGVKLLGYIFYAVGLIWCVKILGFVKRKLM